MPCYFFSGKQNIRATREEIGAGEIADTADSLLIV